MKITIIRELVVTPKKKKGKKGRDCSGECWLRNTCSAAPELSDVDQAKAEMNARRKPNVRPISERDHDNITRSCGHLLRNAIVTSCAGLDDRMIAAMQVSGSCITKPSPPG